MFFKNELSPDLVLDLDQPVNYKILLNVISKLSLFALHTSDYAIRLERMCQTTRIMYALCHINEEDNRQTLHYICDEIYKNGKTIALAGGDRSQLEFSTGFIVALKILDCQETKYSEEWKSSLTAKLGETRAMIRSKAKSIEKKLSKKHKPEKAIFFHTEKREKETRTPRDDGLFTFNVDN